MATTFKAGDVVRVARPSREFDGWIGRFLDPAPVPEHFAYVAFDKADTTKAPDERTYRKRDKALHKLLPLSQLLPI